MTETANRDPKGFSRICSASTPIEASSTEAAVADYVGRQVLGLGYLTPGGGILMSQEAPRPFVNETSLYWAAHGPFGSGLPTRSPRGTVFVAVPDKTRGCSAEVSTSEAWLATRAWMLRVQTPQTGPSPSHPMWFEKLAACQQLAPAEPTSRQFGDWASSLASYIRSVGESFAGPDDDVAVAWSAGPGSSRWKLRKSL